MYSQPPPCRSNIHPCGQWHHQCIDRHRDGCRRRPRLSRPSIRNPPQTNSRINTGIAVHPGNPFFSKNSIVPGNVKTSGLSRPWVNITAPTCDSQDQNPQVDTVLGEEMTIHRNSRLRIKCYDQKKGFRTRRHFVSFKKSGAEPAKVSADEALKRLIQGKRPFRRRAHDPRRSRTRRLSSPCGRKRPNAFCRDCRIHASDPRSYSIKAWVISLSSAPLEK
jgi:hypothetical protein